MPKYVRLHFTTFMFKKNLWYNFQNKNDLEIYIDIEESSLQKQRHGYVFEQIEFSTLMSTICHMSTEIRKGFVFQ